MTLYSSHTAAKATAEEQASAEEPTATARREPASSFVTFKIGGTRYGVDALAVREVVPRPALASLAGAPLTCAGLLDLRGKAVPVMDVSALLGGAMQPPCAADHIIIVANEAGRTGLLVGELCEVRSIAPADVQAIPVQAAPVQTMPVQAASRAARFPAQGEGAQGEGPQEHAPSSLRLALSVKGASLSAHEHPHAPGGETLLDPAPAHAEVFQGVARLDDGLVLLLNLPALLAGTHALASHASHERRAAAGDLSAASLAESEAEVLRARAETLRQRPTIEEGQEDNFHHNAAPESEGVGIAVVTLGGEAFGLPIESVREFCRVGAVTPVPCCPPHVRGQMNLRGDLLTLLDLRAPLGLTQPTPATELKPPLSVPTAPASEMAVIVEVSGIRAGVVVEEVREVTHLRETGAWRGMTPAQGGNASSSAPRLPWGGTLPWGETALNLLDLAQFLSRPELVVREEV